MVQSLAKYYRPGRIVENLILEGGEIAYWKMNCAVQERFGTAVVTSGVQSVIEKICPSSRIGSRPHSFEVLYPIGFPHFAAIG